MAHNRAGNIETIGDRSFRGDAFDVIEPAFECANDRCTLHGLHSHHLGPPFERNTKLDHRLPNSDEASTSAGRVEDPLRKILVLTVLTLLTEVLDDLEAHRLLS